MIVDNVSIIVVCYNESEDRIRYTLDSIFNQTYLNIECIVIDGNSQISTQNAFNRYQSKISKFISEKDKGIYDAMNKGVEVSSGDWILFMNIGDRFINPYVIADMLNINFKNDIDLVYGDILRDKNELVVNPDKISKKYLCFHSICHQAVLARKKIFNVIGEFDLEFRLVADRDWILRVIISGYRCHHVSVVVCDWELGGFCSNQIVENEELKKYRLKYFSWLEVNYLRFFWYFEKFLRRIKSLNFSIPYDLKNSFKI